MYWSHKHAEQNRWSGPERKWKRNNFGYSVNGLLEYERRDETLNVKVILQRPPPRPNGGTNLITERGQH